MEMQKFKDSRRPFTDRIIISSDNRIKSFFDVWVLILVGYSCFSSMYYVAFERPTNPIIILADQIIEVHFWVDMILSFICEYIDPETNLPIRSIK